MGVGSEAGNQQLTTLDVNALPQPLGSPGQDACHPQRNKQPQAEALQRVKTARTSNPSVLRAPAAMYSPKFEDSPRWMETSRPSAAALWRAVRAQEELASRCMQTKRLAEQMRRRAATERAQEQVAEVVWGKSQDEVSDARKESPPAAPSVVMIGKRRMAVPRTLALKIAQYRSSESALEDLRSRCEQVSAERLEGKMSDGLPPPDHILLNRLALSPRPVHLDVTPRLRPHTARPASSSGIIVGSASLAGPATVLLDMPDDKAAAASASYGRPPAPVPVPSPPVPGPETSQPGAAASGSHALPPRHRGPMPQLDFRRLQAAAGVPTAGGRPSTVPARLGGHDALRGRRPGSGGSPTRRREFLEVLRCEWGERRRHEAEVRSRAAQLQEEQRRALADKLSREVNQEELDAREAAAKERERAAWLARLVRLAAVMGHLRGELLRQRAVRVDEYRKKAAACKIARWYKRAKATQRDIELAQLVVHMRPLLAPAVARARERARRNAAGKISAVLAALHSANALALAGTAFLHKMRRIQRLYRDAVVVRLHQRQLLCLQLRRYEGELLRLRRDALAVEEEAGAAKAGGGHKETRKGTGAFTLQREGSLTRLTKRLSFAGDMEQGLGAAKDPMLARLTGRIPKEVKMQVVDAVLAQERRAFGARLDEYAKQKAVYEARRPIEEARLVVMQMAGAGAMLALSPPPQPPRLRVLQPRPVLRKMMEDCLAAAEKMDGLQTPTTPLSPRRKPGVEALEQRWLTRFPSL